MLRNCQLVAFNSNSTFTLLEKGIFDETPVLFTTLLIYQEQNIRGTKEEKYI